MNANDSFDAALAGMSPDLAAELEDHLHEAADASRRRGADGTASRRVALQQLGDPAVIARDCQAAVRSDWWIRRGMPLGVKLIVAGWMALGILFTSRICAASEPSIGSIALCLTLGLGSVFLAASLVRGRRWPYRLALGASLALGAFALLVPWHPAGLPWMATALALGETGLGLLSVFGVVSLATLVSDRSRRWAT